MNSIILKGILIISISLALLKSSIGAQATPQYFADELFNEGKHDIALTEYRRLDFFSPNDYFKHRVGLCHQKLGHLHQSALIFKKLGATEELIQTYLQMEEYALARFVAQGVSRQVGILGWIYLIEGKWELASQNFEPPDLKLAAKKGKKLSYKSETLASSLSIVVPGTGEIYAQKWLPGTITFLLNALSATLAYKSFRKKDYISGALITIFLWSRFYQGGIENATRSAREHNKNLKDRYIKSITQKYKCPFEELK